MIVIFIGIEISIVIFLKIFCVLFMTVLPFIGIAMLAGAFVLYYKQGDPINYITNIIVTLFSGTIYPVEVMPDFMKSFSYLIPTTHSMNKIRSLISNGNSYEINYSYTIFFSLLLIVISIYILNYVINIIKKNGSSGSY